MLSLVNVKSINFSSPNRLIDSVTSVPFGPRICFAASSNDISFVNNPSILTIMSPEMTPFLFAGELSIGEITVSFFSRTPRFIPTPPYFPLVNKGGYIVFDDYLPYNIGSKEREAPKAIDKIVFDNKKKIVDIGLTDDIVDIYRLKNMQNLNGKNIDYIIQKL